MQVQQKGLTTAKNAKDYLSKNEIPQLFECLMTGLMYHRPVDHILYLQECLEKIKKLGINAVHWDMFLEAKKTPLPPIAPAPKEDFRPEPLPEIGSFQLRISPKSSIIILQGGPGIGKCEMSRKICSSYSEYVHIRLGSLVRERALVEAQDIKSKWKYVVDLINEGQFAPEDFVLEVLIRELNKYTDKENFLIDGYPRTTEGRQHFERMIGITKLKFMVLIDCEEDTCQRMIASKPITDEWKDQNSMAITKRINNYKSNTLAVCKYFDDQGKLRVIDGEAQLEKINKDLLHLFDKEFRGVGSPLPAATPIKPLSAVSLKSNIEALEEDIPELTNISKELERQPDLPQCAVILLLGGPGSGKTELATQLCIKHQDWSHCDVNQIVRTEVLNKKVNEAHIGNKTDDNKPIVEDLVVNINAMKDLLNEVGQDKSVVIIEGYPKNRDELNQLNTAIGRIDMVILLDSEEDVMKSRLFERHSRLGSIEDEESNCDLRIRYFKENGLSICRYYDERCQLNIINSDKDILLIIDDAEKLALKFNQNNSALQELEVTNENNNDILYDESASSAAVTIQASIRGHLTRKRLKENQADQITDENDMQLNDEITAIGTEDLEIVNETVPNEDDEDKTHEADNVDETAPADIVKESHEEDNIEETHEVDNVEEYHETDNVEETHEVENVEETHVVDNVEYPIEPTSVTLEGDKGVRTSSQMELKNANIILLLGGPGSGKKTLGDNLVIKYAMSFIHVDQLISSEINSNSENAEELNHCIESNFEDITPILALLRKHLVRSMEVSKNIVVAGFPKSYDQYRQFVFDVAEVAGIIYIDVDSESMQRRLEDEADPDFTSNVTEIIEEFQERNPTFIEELTKLDIFNQINGHGSIPTVLDEAILIIDKYPFMKSDD